MIILKINESNLINNTLILLNYLPLVFIIWLIYLWIKKDNEYMDIVLYSTYAVIIGYIINMILRYYILFNLTFMLSIALMLTYFKETRKSGLILLILGLIYAIINIYLNHIDLQKIIGSIILASITTIIIYYSKKYLIELNQIIKAAYYVLK